MMSYFIDENTKVILAENNNKFILEKTKCRPYNGAAEETDCYRVTVKDADGFTFHVSCYETYGDMINGIKKTFLYMEDIF